jgi:hypothetical protein
MSGSERCIMFTWSHGVVAEHVATTVAAPKQHPHAAHLEAVETSMRRTACMHAVAVRKEGKMQRARPAGPDVAFTSSVNVAHRTLDAPASQCPMYQSQAALRQAQRARPSMSACMFR